MKSAARIFLPHNRIESLILKPGGISREKALERAAVAVEELRDESVRGIWEGIEAIEDLVNASASGHLTVEEMRDILRYGDRIILLSEVYGYSDLATVTMRLCDLIARLIDIEDGDMGVIRVCIQTLRFLAPNSDLGEVEADPILAELRRLLHYYGVRPNG